MLAVKRIWLLTRSFCRSEGDIDQIVQVGQTWLYEDPEMPYKVMNGMRKSSTGVLI
ncbi:MAG: hypothetical protein ACRC1Z_06535 [Waterburya sp.]